jgi:hypothetical protein
VAVQELPGIPGPVAVRETMSWLVDRDVNAAVNLLAAMHAAA